MRWTNTMSLFGLPLPSLDTILSLPFLSIFIVPSLLSNFSWGTSLNLLFFYITWATVVFSHQPLHIELFGALAVRTVFYIFPCTLFLLLDLLLPSLSASIKAQGRRALPYAATRSQTNARLAAYVGVCLFNILLGISLQTGIEYLLTHPLSLRSALRITTTLPMPVSLAKDLTRAYLVRGPLTYYIHKHLLHSPRTSPTLSRWHKAWHHSLTTTLPFSAVYDHPVVYLLHRWLPVYLPAALFRLHMLTYLLFLTLISLEEALVSSGYTALPSTVLLAGAARRAEAHMASRRGNFGPWGVMDWAHGTALPGRDVVDDLQAEARKRDVKGKAKDAAGRAESVTRALLSGEEVESEDDAVEEEYGDNVVERGGQGNGTARTGGAVSSARARVAKALRRKK